jgi:predicted metal-dependent HD superfamily phosphohydrolase
MTDEIARTEDSGLHEYLLRRWLRLLRAERVEGGVAEGEALLARYDEPHRKYHNAWHIAECFELLDEAASQLFDARAVELAIWFHDAVYGIGAADNEARSAHLAEQVLGALGLPEVRRRIIAKLIQCTDHRTPPFSSDARLLVDIDLAILGQPQARYEEYAVAIFEESGLPPADFRRLRGDFLRAMLGRERLFHTDFFHSRFEAAARVNMQRELTRLADHERD